MDGCGQKGPEEEDLAVDGCQCKGIWKGWCGEKYNGREGQMQVTSRTGPKAVRHHSLGCSVSVPAACSRGQAGGSTSPRLSGLQVPGGWLGLLTPAYGCRCLVLVPITISSRATRPIVIQTPCYNSQVWYPSALEPGLGWAAWPLSWGLFVWGNVTWSGIISLYTVCGGILITMCHQQERSLNNHVYCLFLCLCCRLFCHLTLEPKQKKAGNSCIEVQGMLTYLLSLGKCHWLIPVFSTMTRKFNLI